jgi:cell division protein FtsB
MRYKLWQGLYFRASEDILDSTPMTDAAPTTGPGRRMLPPKPGRGRRALWVAMWIGAALLLAESIFGERGFTAMIEARKQHHAMQSSLDRLRAENAALRGRARRLREDPKAIEEIARRDLRLLAPGEVVFIVKDADRGK